MHHPLPPSQPPADKPPWALRRVPQAPAASQLARDWVRTQLRDTTASDRAIADVEVVVGELVANAVMHGRADADGQIEVGCRVLVDRVQVSVCDYGDVTHLEPQHPPLDATGGRGLALIEHIAEQWSYTTDGTTRVTAQLRLDT